jgi:hypothetical protein
MVMQAADLGKHLMAAPATTLAQDLRTQTVWINTV